MKSNRCHDKPLYMAARSDSTVESDLAATDLGPPKTLQPNFGFGSVMNKNFNENTPHQIEEYISKRLLTGTKPTYNEHKKAQNYKDRRPKAVISLENTQIRRYALEPAGTFFSDGI
jgi:hypothetical protein